FAASSGHHRQRPFRNQPEDMMCRHDHIRYCLQWSPEGPDEIELYHPLAPAVTNLEALQRREVTVVSCYFHRINLCPNDLLFHASCQDHFRIAGTLAQGLSGRVALG